MGDQGVKTNVLVIDDDPAVLDSLRTMLETAGFKVTCAAHAHEAIERIRDYAPQVILTDVYMPEGDGFELLSALRKQESKIPVVVMSGAIDRDQLGVARQLGAETISKPFRPADLIGLLNRLTGHGEPHGG